MAQDFDPRNQDIRRPYENRGNAGRVWAWVLFAIVVAFIIWVFASGFGSPNPSHARPRSGDTQGYQSTNASVITDPAVIQNAQDANKLVGRDVEFRNVKIQGVEASGDFWIGGAAGKGVFVVRKNGLNPKDTENGAVKQPNNESGKGQDVANQGTAGNNGNIPSKNDVTSETEGQPNVSIGQTVNLTGKIEKVPDTETVHMKWGVSGANATLLEQQKVYVSADSVSVVQR